MGLKASPLLCRILLVIALGAASSSCHRQEPVRIGFVAGLSGRVADLGVAGRNGAMLAVEQKNRAGGINGRPVELVVRDMSHDPELARKAITELISQQIEIIIGPMTSAMAMAMVPAVEHSHTILLSPTATTTELAGKDDNFLRVIGTTTEYAGKNARYQFEKLGRRRVAAIYDLGNKSYTESWLKDFRAEFEALGGRLVSVQTFSSSNDLAFGEMAATLLTAKPDTVLIIANAIDAAMLCQQVRKQNSRVPIAMSEWGATERFVELAGAASDGLVVAQFLDRNDTSDRYRSFHHAYLARFGQEPGFAGVAGYDAAMVALEAFNRRQHGQTLKDVILHSGSFQGVQQTFTFDSFGDTDRKTYITTIQNGHYRTLE